MNKGTFIAVLIHILALTLAFSIRLEELESDNKELAKQITELKQEVKSLRVNRELSLPDVSGTIDTIQSSKTVHWFMKRNFK